MRTLFFSHSQLLCKYWIFMHFTIYGQPPRTTGRLLSKAPRGDQYCPNCSVIQVLFIKCAPCFLTTDDRVPFSQLNSFCFAWVETSVHILEKQSDVFYQPRPFSVMASRCAVERKKGQKSLWTQFKHKHTQIRYILQRYLSLLASASCTDNAAWPVWEVWLRYSSCLTTLQRSSVWTGSTSQNKATLYCSEQLAAL